MNKERLINAVEKTKETFITQGVKAKVSKGNTKTGAVTSFSTLPAFTCNKSNECYKKNCYAKRLTRYKNVLNAYTHNSLAWFKDPKSLENSILSQIPIIGMFRWHISGDIVNKEYFEMMVRIAKQKPNVKFLAFTKKFNIVNTWIDNNGPIPENLKVVFSEWIGETMDNYHDLPVAYVRYSDDTDARIPNNTYECPSRCDTCGICFNLNNGQSITFNKH